jgi:hypothetical protein
MLLAFIAGNTYAQTKVRESGIPSFATNPEIQKEKPFKSKAGNFSILFPGTPSESIQKVPTDVGEIEMVMYTVELSAGEVYMLAYSDYPEATVAGGNSQDILNGAKEGSMNSMQSIIETESNVTIQGYPAIVFKAHSEDMYMDYEIILVKNRLYQIVAIKSGAYIDEPRAGAFINSFKLLKK